MRRRVGSSAALLLIVLVPCALHAAGSTGKPRGVKTWSWTFQADTLGQEPEHTGVFGGRWEVALGEGAVQAGGATAPAPPDSGSVPDTTATTALQPRVLRQSETDDGIDFHYIRFKKPVLEDMTASVRFRVLSGDIDPTAGLMFQLDPKGTSGYLLRVSGQKSRLIAHYILYGKRRDLKQVDIPELEPGAWHTLSVTRKGHMLIASYDGVERFRVRDERYRKGTVGLWTEDDTVVEFADLTVSTK